MQANKKILVSEKKPTAALELAAISVIIAF